MRIGPWLAVSVAVSADTTGHVIRSKRSSSFLEWVDAEGVDVTIALRVPTLDEEGMCARNVAFPSNNALRRLDWPVGFSEGDIVAFDEMNETAN